MANKKSLEEIRETIDKIIAILVKNYKNKGKNNTLSLEQTHKILKDLHTLIRAYDEHPDCPTIVIKRFIPILNLITKLDDDDERLVDYFQFLKDAYRIGARISLEHYMVYREWEEPENEKFFEPRYNILAGYIHYLEELEMNPDFTTLVFNAPSGYGKTYPKKVAEAWGLGINNTGAYLSLCSNDDVVKSGSRTCIDEMKSEAFGEVFPEMKFNEGDRNYFLKETDEKWKLKTCKLPFTYYAKTTQANVVGSRASKSIHIDDLYPDYKEAMNENLNKYYYNKSITVWEKRFVQNKKPKVCITGTLWASGDYIDLKIQQLKKEHKFKPHKKYKYTLVSEDETCVIIQVPALDYVTNESTCPEIKSTHDLLKEKQTMEEYLWETNFQQKPTNPETLIFSYDKLRIYNTIPETEYIGKYAVIDANRKSGKDYFAMPIFTKVPALKGEGFDYYMCDCLFTRVATKDMYEAIVDKIIQNHIITIVIESNVTSELKKNLDDLLEARCVNYCEILEKYNTETKKVRITNEMHLVKKKLVFPSKTAYGINTDIGRFMNNLTIYNSEGTNANDDAPDSCAMFCSEIIEENSQPQIAIPVPSIRHLL